MQVRLRFELAGGCAIEQQEAFTGVLGESGGAFKFHAGFGEATEFEEKIAAHAGQQVVVCE